MKTHYLHISYQGQKDNGVVILGDCLLKTTNMSLVQIREYLKNKGDVSFLVITHLSDLSEELYEMLSTNTEEEWIEQKREP